MKFFLFIIVNEWVNYSKSLLKFQDTYLCGCSQIIRLQYFENNLLSHSITHSMRTDGYWTIHNLYNIYMNIIVT